jgi:hypothetical protein
VSPFCPDGVEGARCSACHQRHLAGHRWTERLSKLIFLGTPHHRSPLERAGNLLDRLLEVSPYAAPLTRIGGNRAAGITDLRFGNVLDEDLANRQRRYRMDPRTPPLPEGVGCYAIAAAGDARGVTPSTLFSATASFQ